MIAGKILWAINMCFQVYFWMICVRCLLTWLPNLNWNKNPFLNGLRSAVDLYLNLFKKFIPPFGPFDFSPIIAMFVLIIVWQIVLYGMLYLFSFLGMLG